MRFIVITAILLTTMALAGDIRVEQMNVVDAGVCSSRLRAHTKYSIICEPTTYLRLTESDAGIPSRGDWVQQAEKVYDFDTKLEQRYICASSPDAGASRGCSIFERIILK